MSEVKDIKYKLTEEQKQYFASVLLLEDMNNFGKTFSVLLEGEDEMLEPTFIYMTSKGWVGVNEVEYEVTDSGRQVLKNYLEKLTEFRSVFKIYSAVDTAEGEFGYSEYFSFDTDEQFKQYIHEERFEDLRVAVCEMKKVNPLDIIFLEFVDAGRFDFEVDGWQAELVTGLIWDELLEVANTNIHIEDLTEYDDAGNITTSGEDVMKLIMDAGHQVMMSLLQEQSEVDAANEEEDFEEEVYDDGDEEVIETITTVEYIEEPYYDYGYYGVYYDPFYISPCWGVYYY